jgi:signal transduction histidine kinase/CheY-like chemotaxis protein
MRKPRKATFNTLLFVIAFLLLLIGIIIYTQFYTQRNIRALREANANANSTFEINNRLQELVYYVESAELYAREQHKNPKAVSKQSIADTLAIINNHIAVLKKQNNNKSRRIEELDDIVGLVNSKLGYLNTFIKNDETSTPQNFTATQLDQLLAVSLNDSLYNKVLEIQQNLENNLKATFSETNDYSEKVLRLDTLLAIIFILALAILGTLIIKRLLDQLSLIYKLGKEKERADKSANVKEQFLANMSHEIRTPINAVVGFAGLLQKTRLDTDQQQFVNLIQNSGENLLSVVNDILDISKIEAGMMRITKNPFSINEVCTSLKLMFQHKVNEKNLKFVFDYDNDIPSTLIGDAERLNQVLINLLNNAIKFTEKGSVKLAVQMLQQTDKEVKIQFVIKDTGIGISKEKLATVFERFEQADNNTARQYGGTGLGLSIVEKIVDMQGGSISADSNVGEGSAFKVVLSYEYIAETKNAASVNLNPSIVIGSTKKVFSNYKILVAEDNKTNQTLLKFMLQQWDLSYDLAENGQQVLDMLQKKPYDLVLMDIQMPLMDGYEAATRTRKDLSITIPIIAMTAHVMPTEKQKCIDAGMNDYISKPIDEIIFVALLEKYLPSSTIIESPPPSTTVESNKFIYIDVNSLNKLFSGNSGFIHELMYQFREQFPHELEALKLATIEKDKKAVLRWTHHMKTTISALSINVVLRDTLENIDKEIETENWISVNKELDILLTAEPILLKEIDTVLTTKKVI